MGERSQRNANHTVSPPLYVLTSTCLDKQLGITRLEEAIVEIRKNIEGAGGNLTVKMEPKAVTESDDAELQALMEKRERENASGVGEKTVTNDRSDHIGRRRAREDDERRPTRRDREQLSSKRRRSASPRPTRKFEMSELDAGKS